MGEIVIVTCPVCGKKYSADKNRIKHGRQTTCSRECSYELRAQAKRTKLTVNCARCGKPFETTPSRIESGHGVYCSRECHFPPVQFKCVHCGKEFRKSPSTNAQYCSKKCANESEQKSIQASASTSNAWKDTEKRTRILSGIKRRSESDDWRKSPHFQKGNKHPKYKGNKNARLIAVGRYEYKQWHAAILRQCHYTCQRCGKRGGKLEAHHIKPWAQFPELRYDLQNGIALCHECHKEIHKQDNLA